jgi:restriction system protein
MSHKPKCPPPLRARRIRSIWKDDGEMGRRKKTSFADDVIALVALMPWWAGVGLAFVAYLVCHHIAASPLAPIVVEPGKPLPLSSTMVGSAVRVVASLGQYLLPILCLGGAGVSAWKRRSSLALVARTAETNPASAIDGMTWREFEALVAQAFRMRGYSATEVGGDGPDGGIDVVLAKGGEKFLVQCKHWRARRVGVDVVRQLYGVMASRGATGGFVVTSGQYSSDAKAFAQGRNVTLIDGSGLTRLLGAARPTPAVDGRERAASAAEATERQAVPRCPQCNGEMVRRAARRGATAGQDFWGCAAFPKCRGTRAL